MSEDPLNPDVQLKISTAKQKKDTADQAFKSGDVQNALRSYHEALLYLNGVYKNAMQAAMPTGGSAVDSAAEEKPKSEVDEILTKIYANMSACHIKNQNWKRAVETADKALAKDKNNTKALFRKAKALGEQGYFEKAEKILEDLGTKEGADPAAIDAELIRLRAADKVREKAHNQKFKGFLNRDKEEESIPSSAKGKERARD